MTDEELNHCDTLLGFMYLAKVPVAVAVHACNTGWPHLSAESREYLRWRSVALLFKTCPAGRTYRDNKGKVII